MNVKLKVLTAGVLFFMGADAVLAQKTKKDSIGTRNIEEVVVVAYGKQKKETVVGSNLQITSKAFENRPITNISQVLAGAGPGIQISTSTGQPGSGLSVRIRGISSYSFSNEPLYVVDGTPYTGGISALNPNDIESINVLKDAASTSLYGSSAANGVILITTKRGKSGKDSFGFTASTGFINRSIAEYDRVNAAQYYPLVWESMRNGYLTTNPTATLAQANTYATNNLISGNLKNNVYNVANNLLVVDGVLNPSATLKYKDLDWQSPIIETGVRQNYDLTYSGSNGKSNYFSSLSYINEKGYIINSDFQRFNLSINTDSQVKSWLKVGTSLKGVSSTSNNAVDGANNNSSYINPYAWTRNIGPIYSPYAHDSNGNTLYDSNGKPIFDNGVNRGSDAAVGRNVIWENSLNKDLSKNYYVISRAFAEIKLDPFLTVSTNVGYDIRNYRNHTYTNKVIGDALGSGSASRTIYTYQTLTFNQLINYKRSFNSHNFELLGGHESYKYYYDYLYGYKRNQIVDDNYEFSNFVTLSSLDSQKDTHSKESWFARFNYDYKLKYILSASIRRDGSSRFAPDVRWGNFWSLSAGWRIKGENFLKNNDLISELKIRSSYGEVGNDGLDTYYAYKSLFALGYNNASEAGILYSSIADPRITWESNNQMDAAIEFGLFKNRITGTAEWYKRKTEGMLFSVPTPVSAGIPGSSIRQNVGDMENNGLEFAINAIVIDNENLKWSINANASTFKNKVTRLPDGQNEIINGTKKLMVGTSIYDYWLRQWYGVDSTDGSPLFLLADTYAGTSAADIRTVNGVAVTTNYNKAKYDYSGTAIPDFTGSFGTSLKYKNIEFNAQFNYQLGGKTYDSVYAGLMNAYTQGAALSTDILNRWTTPGQVTDVPALNSSTYVSSGAASSRWLVSSDYIQLRTATLSYIFNPEYIKALGLSNLKFFISGENLWSKTARKGLEPVQSFNGTTTNRYTPSRAITFGMNFNF